MSPAPGIELPFERRTLAKIFDAKEIVVTDATGRVLRRLPGSIGTEPGKTVREVIEAHLAPRQQFDLPKKGANEIRYRRAFRLP